MAHNLSFALNIAAAAKKHSNKIKDAMIILNKIFLTVISKLEMHECCWDNTFTKVFVNIGTKLPLMIIDINIFVTTMKAEYHKLIMDKFTEFGFILGEIYYDGPILKCLELYVKKNEK